MTWEDLPFKEKLFENLDEDALTEAAPVIENMYINEAGGHSRFPGMKSFAAFPVNAKVYIHHWNNRGDLIAATNRGFVYRVDQDGNYEDVTGVPLSGGKRVVFAETEDELVMASGGPLIRLASGKTEILADNIPNSSHVAYISGFLLYIENGSQRFGHSTAGATRTFDLLDFFSAESDPDFASAIIVTPFREILIGGRTSIEQFERLQGSATPFFRRWDIGEGVKSPYTLIAADNANWAINGNSEMVRWVSQGSRPTSEDIQATLEAVSDWTDAWMSEVHIKGQQFIFLQIPNSVNRYGLEGITYAYDVRRRQFINLTGWDAKLGAPSSFLGHSYARIWERGFCGTADGRVLEFDLDNFNWAGDVQRMFYRSAHISKYGPANINDCRLRIKRGVAGSNDPDPVINLRFVRDQNRPTRWISRNIGRAGQSGMNVYFGGCGTCESVQVEYYVTDDAKVEIVAGQIDVQKLSAV